MATGITKIRDDLGFPSWNNLNNPPDPNSYLNWGDSFKPDAVFDISYWNTTTPVYAPAEKPVFQSLGARDSFVAKKVDDILGYLDTVDYSFGGLSSIERDALYRRSIAASGFLSGNTGDVKEFTVGTDLESMLSPGDLVCDKGGLVDNSVRIKSNGTDVVVLVNGYQLVLTSNSFDGSRPDITIRFPDAPVFGKRQDMAFLEVWRERIDLSTSKFFYYGNTQYGPASNLPDDTAPTTITNVDYPYVSGTVYGTLDPTHPSVVGTIYVDRVTGKYIQVRYRIRVFSLDFEDSTTNSVIPKNILTNAALFAQGKRSSDSSTANFVIVSSDYGLFAASGDTSLGVGGLAWCIPICFVHRRNQAAFSEANINGGSSRPDLLSFPIIAERDVMDMRHTVTLGTFDWEEVYQKTMKKLMGGSLSTNWYSQYSLPDGVVSTQLDIYGNRHFEGMGIRNSTLAGTQLKYKIITNNGIPAAPDGIRQVWSDAEESQAAICFISDIDDPGNLCIPTGFFEYNQIGHWVKADLQMLPSWNGGAGDHVVFTGMVPKFRWASNGATVNMSWTSLTGAAIQGYVQSGNIGSYEGYSVHSHDGMVGEVYIKFSRGSSFLDRTPVWGKARNFSMTSNGTPLMEAFGYNQYEPLGFDEQTRRIHTFAFISDQIALDGNPTTPVTLPQSEFRPFGSCMRDSDGKYKVWVANTATGGFDLYSSTDLNSFSSPVPCAGLPDCGDMNNVNGISVVKAAVVTMKYYLFATNLLHQLNMYVSTDGVNWTGPTLCTGLTGHGTNIIKACVMFDTGAGTSLPTPRFKMWFINDSDAIVTYAESADGVVWDNIALTPVTDTDILTGSDLPTEISVIMEAECGFGTYKVWLTVSEDYDGSRGYGPKDHLKVLYGFSTTGIYWMMSDIPRWSEDLHYSQYWRKDIPDSACPYLENSDETVNHPYFLTICNIFKDDKVYRTYGIKSYLGNFGSSTVVTSLLCKIVLGMVDRNGSGTSQNAMYQGRGAMDHALRYDDAIGNLPDDTLVFYTEYAPRVHAGGACFTLVGGPWVSESKVVYVPENPVLVSTLGSGYKNMRVIPSRGVINLLDQLNGMFNHPLHNYIARAVIPFDGRAVSAAFPSHEYSLGSAVQFVRAMPCDVYKDRGSLLEYFYSGHFNYDIRHAIAFSFEYLVLQQGIFESNNTAIGQHIHSEAVDFETYFPLGFGDSVFAALFSVSKMSGGQIAIMLSFGDSLPTYRSYSCDAFLSAMVPCGRYLAKMK
jgi:hypothetical protein